MRLIDADELKEHYDITNWNKPYGCSFERIDRQPTAFDLENVIERLDEKRRKYRREADVQMHKYHNEDWGQYLDGLQCGIREAIEIINTAANATNGKIRG